MDLHLDILQQLKTFSGKGNILGLDEKFTFQCKDDKQEVDVYSAELMSPYVFYQRSANPQFKDFEIKDVSVDVIQNIYLYVNKSEPIDFSKGSVEEYLKAAEKLGNTQLATDILAKRNENDRKDIVKDLVFAYKYSDDYSKQLQNVVSHFKDNIKKVINMKDEFNGKDRFCIYHYYDIIHQILSSPNLFIQNEDQLFSEFLMKLIEEDIELQKQFIQYINPNNLQNDKNKTQYYQIVENILKSSKEGKIKKRTYRKK